MAMKPRLDMIDAKSPDGIEAFQLTTEHDVPSCHIYMEAQVFTPDSKRLIVHRSAHPHGRDQHDPAHRYLVCDLDSHGELTPVTDETGAVAPSVSPDGQWMYYFVDETTTGGGRFFLKRVRLDGSGRETLFTIDTPIPGCGWWASRLYPLSTLSSDGERLVISCYLGDGRQEAAPWGLLVFDLKRATMNLILSGPSWCNIHPQYCRSTDPEHAHDIMVQENHGNRCEPSGAFIALGGGAGADIHLIRDNGMHLRTFPWGRDGKEFCQGHQCWIGRTHEAITSTGWGAGDQLLIQSAAVSDTDHQGLNTPGGVRNVLSRSWPDPHFYHFATDIAGTRLITDYIPKNDSPCYKLYLATFAANAGDALQDWTYLLDTQSPVGKRAHTHPFLSPDGTMVFFNTVADNQLQACMVRLNGV